MEARQAFTGTSVSKGLVVVMALGITVGLATVGALATRNLGASHTNAKSTVQAPALPLRQDNDYPVLGGKALTDRGSATHPGRLGGPIDSNPVVGFTAGGISPVLIDRAFVQTHTGRRGGTIDSAGVGDAADGNGSDSDLTRALPGSAPVELPLWIQKEMGVDQSSNSKIVVDQNYIDQFLKYNPGWDARSVREGHGP